MARQVHIRSVLCKLDGRPTTATVTIDRDRQLVTVRPYKRRRTYDWPLDRVVAYVYLRVVMAEKLQKAADKARARKTRRKGG